MALGIKTRVLLSFDLLNILMLGTAEQTPHLFVFMVAGMEPGVLCVGSECLTAEQHSRPTLSGHAPSRRNLLRQNLEGGRHVSFATAPTDQLLCLGF